jgi:hypothetical protein
MTDPIPQFFLTLRNTVKIYHWNTTSYPRHKATDTLVDRVDSISDKFVEIYMGKYKRPSDFKKPITLTLPALTEDSVIKYLNEAIIYLDQHLPKKLSPKDTDLLNLRDELMGEINQTLYLFSLK